MKDEIKNSVWREMRAAMVVSFVLSVGWLLAGHAEHALADTPVPIGNVEPLPGSADIYVDPNNNSPSLSPVTSGQPALAVGDGAFDGNYAWLKVYVPINTDATVTVQNGGGWCRNVNDMIDPNGSQPEVLWSLMDLDATETEFASGGTYLQNIDSLSGGNTSCRDVSFPTIPGNPSQPGYGAGSQIIGHTGYRVFLFSAHILNCPDDNVDCSSQTKEFRVFVNQGNSTTYSFSTSGPLVGFSRAVSASPNSNRPFGVEYENMANTYGNNTDFTYGFQFGTFCTESDTSAPITFYDMDNGTVNPQFLSADIYQSDKSQAAINWILQQHYTANQIGTPVTNHSLNIVNFDAEPLYRYKLSTNRVGRDNAIQFYVPYDQFDAVGTSVNCFDSTCTITNNPAGPLPSGGIYIISVKMTNTGLSGWDPNTYKLAQVNPDEFALTYTWSGSTINNGEQVTFTFQLSSPAGSHTYSYQMKNQLAQPFGDTCSTLLTWTGGGGGPPPSAGAKLGGAQALVDVTGEANDILKRISTRVSLTNGVLPDYSLQSMDSICKRIRIVTSGPSPVAQIDDAQAANVDHACVL